VALCKVKFARELERNPPNQKSERRRTHHEASSSADVVVTVPADNGWSETSVRGGTEQCQIVANNIRRKTSPVTGSILEGIFGGANEHQEKGRILVIKATRNQSSLQA
jgi:hypothetical protein